MLLILLKMAIITLFHPLDFQLAGQAKSKPNHSPLQPPQKQKKHQQNNLPEYERVWPVSPCAPNTFTTPSNKLLISLATPTDANCWCVSQTQSRVMWRDTEREL